MPLNQVLSVLGSLLILGAYFALQRGRLRAEQRAYSALNFVGAAVLAYVAVMERQVGFILLEGTWALLSIPGMLKAPRPLT
jgi:hypothetical protein